MSARTVIENSDDEASDIEQEHVIEQASGSNGDFDNAKSIVAPSASHNGQGAGWNLPPTMQLMFNEHQPNIMFSECSSTVPNASWTQRQIALHLEQASNLPVNLESNIMQSQKSKSSLNWSEHLKSQGLESLVRSQSDRTESQDAAQSQAHILGISQIDDDNLASIDEDQPSLLPIDNSYTPPGTPKMLEIAPSYGRSHPAAETSCEIDVAGCSSTIDRAQMFEASQGLVGDLELAQATPQYQCSHGDKRKSENISAGEIAGVDSYNRSPAVSIPSKVATEPTLPKTKRQKRSKSRQVVSAADHDDPVFTEKDCSQIDELSLKTDANATSEINQKAMLLHNDENALFAPDLIRDANKLSDADNMVEEIPTKKGRGRKPKSPAQLQVVVQVPTKVEQLQSKTTDEDVKDTKPPTKPGRGRPKKKAASAKVMDTEAIVHVDDDANVQVDETVQVTSATITKSEVILQDTEQADQDASAHPNEGNVSCENEDPAVPASKLEHVEVDYTTSKIKVKTGLSTLKSLTKHRVGLSRRTRIPSLLKVVRK